MKVSLLLCFFFFGFVFVQKNRNGKSGRASTASAGLCVNAAQGVGPFQRRSTVRLCFASSVMQDCRLERLRLQPLINHPVCN